MTKPRADDPEYQKPLSKAQAKLIKSKASEARAPRHRMLDEEDDENSETHHLRDEPNNIESLFDDPRKL